MTGGTTITHKVTGIDESNPKNILVFLQVVGTRHVFKMNLIKVYNQNWFEKLSKEDVVYVSYLFACQKNDKCDMISSFPRKKKQLSYKAMVLAMFYVTTVLLSNITAIKIAILHFFGHSVPFPAALIYFPLTYFLDDCITEVYGFQLSRRLIWIALGCNVFYVLASNATLLLPSLPIWKIHQGAYDYVVGASTRVIMASFVAFFCGAFLNSILLSRLKVLTSGKWFFLRVVTSSGVAVLVDSFLFCSINFAFQVPQNVIFQLILVQTVFKFSLEVILFPVTQRICAYIKSNDKVDVFDYGASYNPFSLKVG